jgi:exodeoxyribonuclease V gamma subunit
MPSSVPLITDEITPGFLLMQGNRLELLQQVLIDWLKRYPLAPLENETFLVQSNGMAQWLRLGLARPRAAQDGGLGIATGIEMILPARLQWQCYRAVLGTEFVPAEAPLDKDKLVWRLMRLLPQLIHTPPFLPLHHYVFTNQQCDDRRLYQLALRVADQFDQYQVYRADWLQHWQDGHNDLPAHETRLPDEQRWQPHCGARCWKTYANSKTPMAAIPSPRDERICTQPSDRRHRNGMNAPQGFRDGLSSLDCRPSRHRFWMSWPLCRDGRRSLSAS